MNLTTEDAQLILHLHEEGEIMRSGVKQFYEKSYATRTDELIDAGVLAQEKKPNGKRGPNPAFVSLVGSVDDYIPRCCEDADRLWLGPDGPELMCEDEGSLGEYYDLREQAIRRAGGECEWCGASDLSLSAYHFCKRDDDDRPDEGVWSVSYFLKNGMVTAAQHEARQRLLLCANCHALKKNPRTLS